MQLVYQLQSQVLPNRRHAAPESNVAPAGRCGGQPQCGVDAPGDKVKLRTACHAQRRTWVMRQHKDRNVVWRLFAPPALPAIIRPRTSDRTEHVAANYPGADASETLLGNAVVDSGLAAILALHFPKHTRRKK